MGEIKEVMGSSSDSWKEAVHKAIRSVEEDVRGVEIINKTADVEDGKITTYKVNVKCAI